MSNKTVYLVVRVDISNPNLNEITDEEVDNVISETNYRFGNVGDFILETEICGMNKEYINT